MITPHAQTRLQQRGIPPLVLQWLDAYGTERHDWHGAVIRHFTKQSRRRLERDIGREPVRRMHEYLNAYAVYGSDGSLITAGHRYQRLRRKE
jgi:hypothetical protein